MTTTINASTSNGLVQTADGSGIIKVQSNGVTTNALAWVNFAGASGTRNSSYNVSSVTRNGTGDYTINFASTLSDANYSLVSSTQENRTCGIAYGLTASPLTTASARVATSLTNGAYTQSDPTGVCVAIFGN